MASERRRLWNAVAVVALVGVSATGCASSEKKDGKAAKSEAAAEGQKAGGGNGRLLIYLDEAGHLASVDPKTGDRREIADAVVKLQGLVLPRSGLVLLQARGKENEDGDEEEPDGRLVIADANGATATTTIALKSAPDQYGEGGGDPADLPVGLALRESGGGKRFVMINAETGTLLVNLEKRSTIDLTETVGAPGERAQQTKLSPDERWGYINLSEKGLVLFSTEDPAKHSVIDGEPLHFSPDGKSLFVYKFTDNGPARVWAQPVEGGGDPVVYAEGDVEFRGTVGNSVVVAEPAALYLASRPGDRRPLNIPYERGKDDDYYMNPIGTGGRALMFSGDREDRRWALVDEAEAKVTPLPVLDKFDLVEMRDERIVFGGGFNKEASAYGAYAVLEIASGHVTPAATWDPAGTFGGYPVPAPDGRSVAVSFSREGEVGHHSLVLKPGEGVMELNGSISAWAPDGTAVLAVRLVDDKARMFVIDLGTKQEKDLGPGFGGFWTQR